MRQALLLALAAVSFAQDAILEGVVVDALTGQPIADVRVAPRRHFTKGTKTDALGRFRIEGLPAGRHGLQVSKAGYLGSDYGEAFAAEGKDNTLRLTPAASFAGIVTGEDGQPLAGCMVYAGSFSAPTGTDGRFELEHLRPGEHKLFFLIPSTEIRKHLRVDPETGDRFGYAPYFHDPVPLVLAPGARLDGHRIRLRRERLVEFSGVLVDEATRQPLTGGEVELALDDGNIYADEAFKRQAARGGRFRFDLLPAGGYSLFIYRGGAPGDIPYAQRVQLGRGGQVDASIRVPVFGTVTVRVRTADDRKLPEGLDLSLQLSANRASRVEPMNAEGIVRFAAVPPGERFRLIAQWSGRVNIPGANPAPLPPPPQSPQDRERLGQEMRQRLRELAEKAMREGPPKWYIRQITAGGRAYRDLQQFPLTGGEQIEVVISDATGNVVFEASDKDGKAVPDAAIYVRSTLSQMVAVNTRLSFPEGELEAAAFPAGTGIDKAAQSRCGERQTLTVKAGADARLRLRLCE